ncbi:hypothetical protein KS4_10420 [Poriferisphaera corsica]|uniref:Uncharacterized protein n=1 Tax=Poriferisphaera corsica TaxID=2528020 RepID=A0A517YS10_9BACT|nr:hypothetical protein [Poriferisphaera corsica]QDU33003.1 hypothetical protein KS4_10420 [Poriferisphaera corsica]
MERKIAEPLGELVLRRGEEVLAVRQLEGCPDDLLVWVKVYGINWWEVLVMFWPEVLTLVLMLGLLVYVWRWKRLRGRIKEVRRGEWYCMRCGYGVRDRIGTRKDDGCGECGKQLDGKVRVRGWWRGGWLGLLGGGVIVLVLCMPIAGYVVYRSFIDPDTKEFIFGDGAMGYFGWRQYSWEFEKFGGMMDWSSRWGYSEIVEVLQDRDCDWWDIPSCWFELRAVRYVDGQGLEHRRLVTAALPSGEVSVRMPNGRANRIELLNVENSMSSKEVLFSEEGEKYVLSMADQLFLYDKLSGELERFESDWGLPIFWDRVEMHRLDDRYAVICGSGNGRGFHDPDPSIEDGYAVDEYEEMTTGYGSQFRDTWWAMHVVMLDMKQRQVVIDRAVLMRDARPESERYLEEICLIPDDVDFDMEGHRRLGFTYFFEDGLKCNDTLLNEDLGGEKQIWLMWRSHDRWFDQSRRQCIFLDLDENIDELVYTRGYVWPIPMMKWFKYRLKGLCTVDWTIIATYFVGENDVELYLDHEQSWDSGMITHDAYFDKEQNRLWVVDQFGDGNSGKYGHDELGVRVYNISEVMEYGH